MYHPYFHFQSWLFDFIKLIEVEKIEDDFLWELKDAFDRQIHDETEFEYNKCDIYLEYLNKFNGFMKMMRQSTPKFSEVVKYIIEQTPKYKELKHINGVVKAIMKGHTYKSVDFTFTPDFINPIMDFLDSHDLHYMNG